MRGHKMIRPLAYLTALLIVASGFLLFWPNDDSNDTYQVTAYFDKAIGLFPNSDVNVLGVPVGKILEVDPSGQRVKVAMELSKEYKIPADATAQIVPISLISDRYIEFAPAYTSGPALEDGAVIGVDRTQIPAELDDVFKQLKKLLDAIQPGGPGEPGALGELIVELDQTFSGQEDNLQGALTEGAQLTETLATTKEDLQGLLANLDSLFGKLATRSGEFGTLNKNLISVLTAVSESRDDLEGTLVNLADLSEEVTDLARDQGGMLEKDLRRVARILKVVLNNEKSVRQSLSWLPVLGYTLKNAYNPHTGSVDVRDNANAKIECEILDDIPDILDPIKEILEEICKEETGEPGDGDPGPLPIPPQQRSENPALPQPPDLKIDCSEDVARVKKQLRRINQLGLPENVKQELLKPLGKRLKRLARECEDLAEKIEDPQDLLEDVLDNLPDVGDLPKTKGTVGGLTGSASGEAVVPTAEEEEEEEDDDDNWFENVLGFVGL